MTSQPGAQGPDGHCAPARAAVDFGPKYRALGYIGRGSAGEVHLAEQLHPVRREVALKLFPWSHPSARERRRFEREALALARLTHPGIAQVHEAATTPDGRLFIAMEHVPGTPIDEACAELDLTIRQRIALTVQICAAVEHAHQRGVIHRDLKPNNLLVAGEASAPIAKVIDFGIARLLDEDSDAGRTLTRDGEVVGTLDYMSPEQRVGGGVDRRSDVFAIGRILARIASPALRAEAGHRDGSELPKRQRADLRAIVRAATAIEPDDRYSTPMAMADDLRRVLQDRPVRARRTGRLVRAARLCRRHPVTSALLTTVVVVLTVLAVLLVHSRMTLAAKRDELATSRDALAAELLRTRTLTVELLDDVLDRLYPVVGAGEARQALTTMLLDHTTALLELAPDDFDLREAHARLVVELGNHAFEAWRLEDALELRAKAVALLDALAAERPGAVALRRRQAEAIVRLGDTLLDLNREDEGRVDHRRAHEIIESLAAAHPDHTGVLDDLTWSIDRLWGDRDLDTDPDRVLALLDRRLALAERLVALDPDRILSRFTMMEGHRRHAIALLRFGRSDEALAAGERAIAIGTTLADEAPHTLHYRLNLAYAHLQAGHAAHGAGDSARRRAHWREADHISAALLASDPDHGSAIMLRVSCLERLVMIRWPDDAVDRGPERRAELERLRSLLPAKR